MYKDMNRVNADVTEIAAIKNSIRNILGTPKGSLPGRPDFGSSLFQVLFQPLDHLVKSIATNYVREALSEFEPRVVVDAVEFKSVPEFNRVVIDISIS